MRLLIINPNISTGVSELIQAEAARSTSPGTQIIMRTAGHGVQYIETRMEAILAAGATAEVIAEERGEFDAVLVAAFGDPGIPGLKELVDAPVIGITEAAMCAAAMLGQRFSIIAISSRIRPWYQDAVDRFGFTGRLASMRCLADDLGDINTVQQDFREPLQDLAIRTVRDDGADAVILAGAPLAGLARSLGDAIPVPTVDGIAAGVRMCEALAGLHVGRHAVGAFAAPPAKPRNGLSSAMNTLLNNAQQQHDTITFPADTQEN